MLEKRDGKNDPSASRPVAIWLLFLCGLIFAMVLLGGYTRLRESGLSMTDWRPVTGLLPPLDAEAWQAEFARYQQFPEFQKLNSWMDVAAFKAIYLVEYAHRMLGRLIGLAFLIPFLIFTVTKRISPALRPKLALMFILGAVQGGLGWFMVKSGLVDRPDVSPYRLTAHLGLAVAILGYIFWVALGLLVNLKPRGTEYLRGHAWLVASAVFLQILSGGLVAGLNAGHAYNTWPLIDGALIPTGLLDGAPPGTGIFENILAVQFMHRMLGYLTVILAVALWWRARRGSKPRSAGPGPGLVALLALGQAALGVITLVNAVPVALGLAHQGGALLVFTAALFTVFHLKGEGNP
ncbi:MAG: COX15/CtaA family protein [Sphingomonadales bacterium]